MFVNNPRASREIANEQDFLLHLMGLSPGDPEKFVRGFGQNLRFNPGIAIREEFSFDNSQPLASYGGGGPGANVTNQYGDINISNNYSNYDIHEYPDDTVSGVSSIAVNGDIISRDTATGDVTISIDPASGCADASYTNASITTKNGIITAAESGSVGGEANTAEDHHLAFPAIITDLQSNAGHVGCQYTYSWQEAAYDTTNDRWILDSNGRTGSKTAANAAVNIAGYYLPDFTAPIGAVVNMHTYVPNAQNDAAEPSSFGFTVQAWFSYASGPFTIPARVVPTTVGTNDWQWGYTFYPAFLATVDTTSSGWAWPSHSDVAHIFAATPGYCLNLLEFHNDSSLKVINGQKITITDATVEVKPYGWNYGLATPAQDNNTMAMVTITGNYGSLSGDPVAIPQAWWGHFSAPNPYKVECP